MTTKTDEEDPWGPMPSWAKRMDKTVATGNNEDDRDSEEEEEDDNDVTNPYFSEAESTRNILILIDMNLQMFKPCMELQSTARSENDPESRTDTVKISPFDAALLAAEKLFRLRIHRTASKRDSLGILLYGTRKKPAYSWKETGETGDSQKSNKSTSKGKLQGGDQSDEDGDEDDDDDEEDDNMEAESGTMDESDHMDDSYNEYDDETNKITHHLLPLQSPSVELILRLRQCLPTQSSRSHNYYLGAGPFVHSNSRPRDLQEELVGRSDQENNNSFYDAMFDPAVSFAKALKDALSMFQEKSGRTKSPKTKDTKAIWIFTNDENPFSNCVDDKDALFTSAKDIRDNGINIQLWPMPMDKQDFVFDTGVFFDQVLSGDKAKGNLSQNDTASTYYRQVHDMLNDINVQAGIPHKYQTLPLLLPDWQSHLNEPCIMLDLYALVQIKRKPTEIRVHKDTLKRMVKTSEILIKDTSELITKDRIRNYMDLWNYHLPISPYEVAGIKMNANAAGNNISLILNGFKSMDSFSYTYLMDKAVFAYPTDSEVRGSTRAFLALYRSMLKKNVMGIGELLVRKTAASRQVCIIPHQGDLYASEAFLILQLPYREEVRKVPTHSQSADDHDALAKCTNLLQQQTISGEIDFRNSFPNPSLKNYWSFIESIALNMPLDQRTTHCFNSFDNFANPPSDAIEAFRASLPEDEIPTKTAKKRAVKEKTPDTTGIDWETAYETDKSNGTDTCLSKYKNDSMKDFLRSVGEKVSGNKGELVARIKAYFKAREP